MPSCPTTINVPPSAGKQRRDLLQMPFATGKHPRQGDQGGPWRATPTSYPVCVDCHDPTRVLNMKYPLGIQRPACMKCHGDSAAPVPGAAKIRPWSLERSEKIRSPQCPCIQCHVDVSINKSPVCHDAGKVQCASCHAEVDEMYEGSIHAALFHNGDKDAPTCVTCHGDHAILSKKADGSPISVSIRRNSAESATSSGAQLR